MNAKPVPECGTVQAYWRHNRLREPIDQQCADAAKTYRREAKTRPPRPLAPCGTESAYSRHRKRREPVDQACREAHAAAHRARYRDARIEREIERILPHLHLENPEGAA